MMLTRLLTLFTLTLVVLPLSIAAAHPATTPGTIGTWSLTNTQSLNTLAASFGMIVDARSAQLAPDGRTLAWTDADQGAVCVGNLDASAARCYAWPAGMRSSDLFWSPDSRRIATHADALIERHEPDIWLLDVASGAYTNLTDDGIDLLTDNRSLIDLTPAWNPATGDLYFFRMTLGRGNMTNVLHRIAAGPDGMPSGVPQPVADLSTTFSQPFTVYNFAGLFSLDGSAAVAPDGTQMAILVRPSPNNCEQSAVWLVDLATGAARPLVTWPALRLTGMPAWYDADGDEPDGLAWADSSTVMLLDANPDYYNQSLGPMARRIDVQTGAVTPLLNFDSAATPDQFFKAESGYDALWSYDRQYGGVLVPDGSAFLYFNVYVPESGEQQYGFSAIPLKSGAAHPVRLGTMAQAEFEYAPMVITSAGMSAGVMRVLTSGYLLTFAPSGN